MMKRNDDEWLELSRRKDIKTKTRKKRREEKTGITEGDKERQRLPFRYEDTYIIENWPSWKMQSN